ncbi:MAG: leucine-rich repeat protein [Clostridia bacterium]|nr:leucine-rich repeat protein [Clostridia bacterium]
MKNFFKIIALVLVIVTALTLFAGCANKTAAEDAEGEWENVSWSYKKESKTLTITGGGAVPSAKDSASVPWKSIRGSVEKLKFVTTAEAPFTSVGDYAFYGMTALKSIELPTGVTSIGKCSFAFCPALDEIHLPETLTTIGESAFEGCKSVLALEIPASVTSVGERSFAFCRRLEIITFKGKVSEIGKWTFKECENLDSLRMDTSGVSFDASAFEGAGIDSTGVKSLNTSIVSIVCKDSEGNEIQRDPSAKTLELGEKFTVTAPVIEGYTVGEKTSEEVEAKGEAIVVEFTYTKNATEEATDEPAPEETDTPAGDVSDNEDDGIKPGTVIMVIVFVVVIVGIAVGAFLLMRADKKTTKDSRTVRKNKDGNYKKNSKNKKK